MSAARLACALRMAALSCALLRALSAAFMLFAAGVLKVLAELPAVEGGIASPDGEAEGAPVLACDAAGVELLTVAASSAPHAARTNDASATITLTRKEERESPFIRASRFQRNRPMTACRGRLAVAGNAV
ncbi:hypothetical protein PCAR4_50043 [Paraburkholderia caribensis]|nr:hypothetical protein PCAR4_50043 [Paraburkholderia caribensis]